MFTNIVRLLKKLYGRNLYHRRDRGVKYVGFADVLMLDWDIPAEGHVSQNCVTITCREEALAVLEAFCAKYPGKFRFRVYETPGGVRAFLLSGHVPAHHAAGWQRVLRCDPLYTEMCYLRGACWCRVSPKVGRTGDYVARPWKNVGTGPVNPSVCRLVNWHDKLCSRYSALQSAL